MSVMGMYLLLTAATVIVTLPYALSKIERYLTGTPTYHRNLVKSKEGLEQALREHDEDRKQRLASLTLTGLWIGITIMVAS